MRWEYFAASWLDISPPPFMRLEALSSKYDADQPVLLRRGGLLAQHGAAGQHQGEGEYECDREFLHVVPPI
jgi:hypothetical protein